MGKRRKARELALQSLYELEAKSKDAAEVLADQAARRGSSPDSREYAARLVGWVDEEGDALDAAISARLEHWDIARLSLVVRLLLRLALAEARRAPEVPSKVLLDEAIEIARKFDGDEGARFVNGILEPLLAAERGGLSP